jgi:hypothetical protein
MMSTKVSQVTPVLIPALLLALCLAPAARAQASFAGSYAGTFNTRVSVPGVLTQESPVGPYLAVVTAEGTINLSAGVLTGTVSASGAVTFTGGTGLATFGIRSATIAGNQLSSAYGDVLGNGTVQYRLNPSTSFTPAGGGSGGGGSGGGTGGGGGSGGGTAAGDLLAHYSFDNVANLLRDDSGRGFNLNAVQGVVAATAGRVGAGALRTSGVRLRALVDASFSSAATTISFFVRPTAAGSWNPRLVAVGPGGSSSHFYGLFLEGASTAPRRAAFLQDGNGSYPPVYSAAGAVPTGSAAAQWTHLAVTHDGRTAVIYVNGAASATAPDRRALGTFAAAMLMVGGSDNGLDLFTGDLDEIRIFNRALSAAEVVTLAGGGAVGSPVSTPAAASSASALPADVIAAPANLAGYRSRVGQSVQLLVTGASSGAIWGTDVYTDDSSVARAAVHAGVVAAGETRVVSVTLLPGQSSYAASTRNGVSSAAWGAWSGSFAFAGSSGAPAAAGAGAVRPSVPAGFRPAALTLVPGNRLTLPIPVLGSGPFTFQWLLNGVILPGATANPYTVAAVSAVHAGTYTVRVTGPGGTETLSAGTVTVPASAAAPQIVLQPLDKVVAPGGTFALAVSALGAGVNYQWLRNGSVLAGETGAILLRQNVNLADAGQYTARMTGGGVSVTSSSAAVTLNPDASRLSNLSGRIAIGGADRVIPGFFIAGSGRKRVLIRAVGPGLAAFGVGGTMADPDVEVYAGETRVATNASWNGSLATVFSQVGAFGLPAGSRDAALLLELDAGRGYTIHVFSGNGEGGVVLFEVYDAGNVTGASKFTNVSVRGPTGTEDSTLILGLNVAGQGKRTLLTRGIGPTLAAFGVSGAIPDPRLEIFDGSGRAILANNDWSTADFIPEMLAAREFVGAFALPGGSADASTLALLDPGSYTLQITAGSGVARGDALVEIYEVP